MKKIFLFIILLILMFTALGCSNDKLDPKEETLLEDNEATYEFINIDIDDLYFVGEESVITISIYPEREIDSISYKSNNEEIITIDNNGHLKALKEGKVLITITIDGKEEKRIVEVEEDEVVSVLNEYSDNTTSLEWSEMHQRHLAREEEAKEHGFSSYKEYREYLKEQKRQEQLQNVRDKYEEECRVAESLGLTWEEYICLQEYKITFDELNELRKVAGRVLEVYYFEEAGNDVKTGFIEKISQEDKNNIFAIKVGYLTAILGSFLNGYSSSYEYQSFVAVPEEIKYGEYYNYVILYNNYGFDVDEEAMRKINEALPGADEYMDIYNYLKDKVNPTMARIYLLYYIDQEQVAKNIDGTVLYEKEFEEIDKIMENYEK